MAAEKIKWSKKEFQTYASGIRKQLEGVADRHQEDAEAVAQHDVKLGEMVGDYIKHCEGIAKYIGSRWEN